MRYTLLALAVIAMLAASSISNALSVVDCTTLFQNTGPPTYNPYAGVLAKYTGSSSTFGIPGFGGLLSIALLIVLAIFSIAGIAYAIGFAFHLQTPMNFARAEFLESFGNLVIIAFIGVSFLFASPAVSFFSNFATINQGASASGSSGSIPSGPGAAHDIYVGLCNGINSRIIDAGLENWFGVFTNLFVANIFAVSLPPGGGFKVVIMPNQLRSGISFNPFQGDALLIQLLWDEQVIYFSSIFMGMFMVAILFFIYFLFPLFLYVGIVLRSFPWTRPAGGSLIALFISFYIIFPALMYPFIFAPGISGVSGIGFCGQPSFASNYGDLCHANSFLTATTFSYLVLKGSLYSDFGKLYYENVAAFADGIEFIGLDLIGLIIALIIAYEMIEKIGTILGAPSLQGARMLGRVV